jgi:hypothetical protein
MIPDLDSLPIISLNLLTNIRLEPLDYYLTITSILIVETFPTSGQEILELISI